MLRIVFSLIVLFNIVFNYSSYAKDEQEEIPKRKTLSLPLLISPKVFSVCNENGYHFIQGISLTLYGIGLFKSPGLVGQCIRGLSRSHWSHVAAILRDVERDQTDQTGWYCFEVQTDIYNRDLPPHVQINPWRTVVEKYKGDIAIRPIHYGKTPLPKTAEILDFAQGFLGRPFKQSYFSFVLTFFQMNQKHYESKNLESVFCSELIAYMFTKLRLLPDHTVAGNYLPKHFSIETDLILTGASLGEEIYVKRHKSVDWCPWVNISGKKGLFVIANLLKPAAQAALVLFPCYRKGSPFTQS